MQVKNTGEGSNLATVPTLPPASREAQTAEFCELMQTSSPRVQSIIKALLLLLSGKTLKGKPLSDTEREEALALVLPELEKLRADGSPHEDAEALLREIAKGGKRS